MSNFHKSVRYAIRSLWKRPGFSLIVIFTLALGIGANTAMFSIVNAVLLSPLRYGDPDKLVSLSAKNIKQDIAQQPISYPNTVDLQQGTTVFEYLSIVRGESFSLTDHDQPERITGLRASTNILSALGVTPVLGRNFLPEEEQPAKASVALITHGIWQRRYAGDPGVIGQTIIVDAKPYTIIGILPAWLKAPGLTLTNSAEPEVWIPLMPAPNEQNRNFANMRIVARLKSGISLERAQSDVDALAIRLERQYPDANTNLRFDVVGLRELLTGRVSEALWVLLGVVACVLLIACVNVANLLLARAASRQSEVAVRTALGASRPQLIREFLTECIVLSLTGGILGLLLAYLGVRLMTSLSSGGIPRAEEISISPAVLLFTLVISLLTGIAFGVVPAFQFTSSQLTQSLKEGKKGASGGVRYRRSLGALVVIEVALALVLVSSAGLMIRSFRLVIGIDPGFDPQNVLTFPAALPLATYQDQQQQLQFFDRALAKIQMLPDVRFAAGTFRVPLGGFAKAIFTVQGKPVPIGQAPQADYRAITSDYFRAMGIRLIKGRVFSEHDNANAAEAVIVNEELARRSWPGEDPIGKRLQIGAEFRHFREVVGLVADARLSTLEGKVDPAIYVPFQQNTWAGALRNSSVVIRTNSDPHNLIPALRREFRSVDPSFPITQVRTMDEIIGESLSQRKFNTTLLTLFAFLAGALAIVGIYGVMSYNVTQRTREMGIRAALGARNSDLTKLVTSSGARLAALGIVIGIVASVVSGRLLSSLLFGVTATDPLTLVFTAALLGAIMLLASYIPSRRAASADPIAALRYD
jgi:putative ABC transport system permease protein